MDHASRERSMGDLPQRNTWSMEMDHDRDQGSSKVKALESRSIPEHDQASELASWASSSSATLGQGLSTSTRMV